MRPKLTSFLPSTSDPLTEKKPLESTAGRKRCVSAPSLLRPSGARKSCAWASADGACRATIAAVTVPRRQDQGPLLVAMDARSPVVHEPAVFPPDSFAGPYHPPISRVNARTDHAFGRRASFC